MENLGCEAQKVFIFVKLLSKITVFLRTNYSENVFERV